MVFWIFGITFSGILTAMFFPVGILFFIAFVLAAVLRAIGLREQRRQAGVNIGLERYMGGAK